MWAAFSFGGFFIRCMIGGKDKESYKWEMY